MAAAGRATRAVLLSGPPEWRRCAGARLHRRDAIASLWFRLSIVRIIAQPPPPPLLRPTDTAGRRYSVRRAQGTPCMPTAAPDAAGRRAELLYGVRMRFFGELPPRDEPALIMLNHRTELDWMMIWAFLARFGRLEHCKIILKGAGLAALGVSPAIPTVDPSTGHEDVGRALCRHLPTCARLARWTSGQG